MSVFLFSILIVIGLIGLIFYSRYSDELNKCPKCNSQMQTKDLGIDEFLVSHSGDIKNIVEKKCPKCNFIYFNRSEISPP